MDNQQIEQLMKADMQLAVRAGHPIDFMTVGISDRGAGIYEPDYPGCPVCIYGAALLGARADDETSYTSTFALLVERPIHFASGFYSGSYARLGYEVQAENEDEWHQGWNMARRLREWAIADPEIGPHVVRNQGVEREDMRDELEAADA